MMTDPIADFLTRLRNAAAARHTETVVPYSKLKLAIAEILRREGYLSGVTEEKTTRLELRLKLRYSGGQPVLQSLKRVSKPGQRRYVKKNDIGAVLGGMGIVILSTPRGILTGKEARTAGVGGEVLCEIY